jgi:FKBP-type peptidyl-prolyl cis-trans isomerase SlpA
MSSRLIQPGAKVCMHFRICLEDGTEAESSFSGEPQTFTMGDGSLIPGLERALYGLHEQDQQTLRLPPREAFGARDASAIQQMPRGGFPADMVLEPGVIVGFSTPSGDEVPGIVLAVDEQQVKVDFNHPLAGHEIQFEVEIISVDVSDVDGA